jgi:hypothetical protein
MVAPPLAFVDTETVRLVPDHGSALWELAILLRQDGQDAEYLWHVRPSLEHAEPKSLQVGRYYERCKVADSPAGSGRILASPAMRGKTGARQARLIAHDVAVLLDGALIIGANPWFDAGHVDAFLREHGQCLAADYHMRDIGSVVDGYLAGHDLARRNCAFCKHEPPEPLRRPESMRLTEIARVLGINPDSYDTHTALGDARLTRAIWNAVMPS